MSEDLSGLGKIVEATKEIVKPLYEDAAQKSVVEVGNTLHGVIKTVLLPLNESVYCVNKIWERVHSTLEQKLSEVEAERIHTPPSSTALPILQALVAVEDDSDLRDAYLNLLAASMYEGSSVSALRGFVGILNNMSADEARIMRYFSKVVGTGLPVIDLHSSHINGLGFKVVVRNFSIIGIEAKCEIPHNSPIYLDNLCRLGLLEIPSGLFIKNPDLYKPLENDSYLERYIQAVESTPERKKSFEQKLVRKTSLGEAFCKSCIYPPSRLKMESFIT